MMISQHATTFIAGLVLLQRATAQQDPSVVIAPPGNDCPDGYVKLATPPGCTAAMREVGLSGFRGTEDDGAWPGGCYHCQGVAGCADGVWFNGHDRGAAHGGARPLCAVPGWEDGRKLATLFVGDSDIAYWDTDSYPNSANVGVGGDTCADVNRLLDARLREYQPERVVLVCGENDLAAGQGVDPAFAEFRTAIGKILGAGARAVYLGTKPEPDTGSLHGKYRQYDAKIRDYVEALAVNDGGSPPLVMVDVYPAFVGMGNPRNLYAGDGLHLSDRGYAYWNTWTKTVLADESDCSRWMNDACVSDAPLPPSPSAPPSPPPTTAQQDPSVVLAPPGNDCPDGYVKLATLPGCTAAMTEVGLSDFQGTEDEATWPGGCYHCQGVAGCADGVWYNSNSGGSANSGARPICAIPGWEDSPPSPNAPPSPPPTTAPNQSKGSKTKAAKSKTTKANPAKVNRGSIF